MIIFCSLLIIIILASTVNMADYSLDSIDQLLL
jgi:hypothetical protein